LDNPIFQLNPTIAIGGPGANGVAQEFSAVLPTVYNHEEQVFVQEHKYVAEQAVNFKIDKELKNYLAGIRHTVHVQTYGFGLGDVSNYWSR
jgi:hypothetical protein